MKINGNVVLAAVLAGGFIILGIVVSMTIMAIDKVDIPTGVLALYGVITSAFLTGIFAAVAHTLGFQNGTTNGENAAQASALRTVMHTDDTPHA